VARAGGSQERETKGSANGARFDLSGEAIPAEPWPERAVAKSGKPEAPQMGRDLISVAKPFLRSRGPSGP